MKYFAVVNELSCQQQAATVWEARDCVTKLLNLAKDVRPFLVNSIPAVHSKIFLASLVDNIPLTELMSSEAFDHNTKSAFLILLTSGPKVDSIYKLDKRCSTNGNDVTDTGVHGAAEAMLVPEAEGMILSFVGTTDYNSHVENVEVVYEVSGQTCNLVNLACPDDTNRCRRIYELNPKHRRDHYDENDVAGMDIDDETAQRVLDEGMPFGNRIFGIHNEVYYEFKSTRLNIFHGFRIQAYRVPKDIQAKLRSC